MHDMVRPETVSHDRRPGSFRGSVGMTVKSASTSTHAWKCRPLTEESNIATPVMGAG